jgi:hypothetical protein
MAEGNVAASAVFKKLRRLMLVCVAMLSPIIVVLQLWESISFDDRASVSALQSGTTVRYQVTIG